jgi:hypothetical protein
VLILTANHYFALRGARPDTRLAKVARRLHVGQPFVVGLNRWYLFADGTARGVFKVRRGTIQEVGIASRSLTSTRAKTRRFIRSFT